MHNKKLGTLYVVATPIGNLQDISLRAIEVLKKADKIIAEDTRRAMRLLNHFSINKPTLSLHEFNERDRTPQILEYLEQGEMLAFVSDAGTPLISDPGFYLVKTAKSLGIDVVPIPGPCAAIVALSVAGLPTDKFTFEGFLPSKEESRHNRLTLLIHESRTMIFYEAPHRLLVTLKSMCTVFGPKRFVTIARELTKIHESIRTDHLEELIKHFSMHENEVRGEIVIVLQGVEEKDLEKKEVVPENVLDLLLKEMPMKQAVTLASKITGERKNTLYEMALAKMKKEE
jgi:16S rRNA (cytidine1402-2'-O)-methyltransferase